MRSAPNNLWRRREAFVMASAALVLFAACGGNESMPAEAPAGSGSTNTVAPANAATGSSSTTGSPAAASGGATGSTGGATGSTSAAADSTSVAADSTGGATSSTSGAAGSTSLTTGALGDASTGAATGGGGMAAISTEACGNVSVDLAAVDHTRAGRIVVLGSSTAAGQNASSADKAWVERYRGYLAEEFPNFAVDNLALGGFNTYRIQPSDYVPPSGRPLPMPGNNITTALEKAPDAIIINLPSNDEYEGFSLEEQLANYQRVTDLAQASGVLVWVATPQPRDFAESEKRQDLLAAKDAIQERFAPRAIDFWSDLANPDGSMKSSYNSGDGTHFNDAGHAVLVQLVVSCAIPEIIAISGQ